MWQPPSQERFYFVVNLSGSGLLLRLFDPGWHPQVPGAVDAQKGSPHGATGTQSHRWRKWVLVSSLTDEFFSSTFFSHSWSLSGHFRCVKASAHPRLWPKWNFNRKALSVIGRCDKTAVFLILNDFNDSSTVVVWSSPEVCANPSSVICACGITD